MPLIVILFVVMCGFVGLTIDVGYGLLEKRRLQAAVDLGLLSGAQELPGRTTAATEARNYTTTNFRLVSDEPITINTSTSCMVQGCSNHDRLTLSASTQTPTFFLSLFGVDSFNVAAQGSACGPCDSSIAFYDVVVVLDRSNSMSDQDMVEAKEGVRELLGFFDPDRDRIGLAVLDAADSNGAIFSGGNRSGCTRGGDTGGTSFTSTTYAGSDYTGYGGSAGAFMDGTAASHDPWLLVALSEGTTFKNANGTLNENSTYLNTLDCIDNKGSTPIGPAVLDATNELNSNGRDEARKVIVYFGDGGASSVPHQRQCRSRTSSSASWGSWRACATSDAGGGSNRQWRINSAASWYTWTTGNGDRPCADAIAQSDRAANLGIDVYTIGYGVSTDYCRPGMSNSPAESPAITQRSAIEQMASSSDKYYQQTARGDIQAIFAAIGREITAGGTRLVD